LRLRAALLGAAIALLAPAQPAYADAPGPKHRFAITREGDKRLPGHTIFHPRNLSAPKFKLPVVAWGNGGCRNSNEEFRFFLMNFASFGYLIVANGPPENPYHPEELDGLVRPQPQKLVDAIEWAVSENARRGSKYYRKLDTSRIALMGQSCGAWEAIAASADERVKSTIAWNNGGDPHGDASKLHAPVAYVNGGSRDFMFWNGRLGYERTSNAPAVHASNPDGGHTDWWDDPPDGSHPDIQREPLLVAQRWLEATLYKRSSARAFFIGTECGLCSRPGWSVESKGWD
jgi:dienelactone hydrolase